MSKLRISALCCTRRSKVSLVFPLTETLLLPGDAFWCGLFCFLVGSLGWTTLANFSSLDLVEPCWFSLCGRLSIFHGSQHDASFSSATLVCIFCQILGISWGSMMACFSVGGCQFFLCGGNRCRGVGIVLSKCMRVITYEMVAVQKIHWDWPPKRIGWLACWLSVWFACFQVFLDDNTNWLICFGAWNHHAATLVLIWFNYGDRDTAKLS